MEMEIEELSDSSSSSDSVVLVGYINPARKGSTTPNKSTPNVQATRYNDKCSDENKQEEAAGKSQDDEINTVDPLLDSQNCENAEWSDSETKSQKGNRGRNATAKYLKKIKTLQQNKRRQETRISRLTKEVRTLRDKNSIQAAYIDVLSGMLGEDVKGRFKDRQGLGILGNLRTDSEDIPKISDNGHNDNGIWDGDDDDCMPNRRGGTETEIMEKEKDFYCVEDLELQDDADDFQEDILEELQPDGNHFQTITNAAPAGAMTNESMNGSIFVERITGNQVGLTTVSIIDRNNQKIRDSTIKLNANITSQSLDVDMPDDPLDVVNVEAVKDIEMSVNWAATGTGSNINTRHNNSEYLTSFSNNRSRYSAEMNPTSCYMLDMNTQQTSLAEMIRRPSHYIQKLNSSLPGITITAPYSEIDDNPYNQDDQHLSVTWRDLGKQPSNCQLHKLENDVSCFTTKVEPTSFSSMNNATFASFPDDNNEASCYVSEINNQSSGSLPHINGQSPSYETNLDNQPPRSMPEIGD